MITLIVLAVGISVYFVFLNETPKEEFQEGVTYQGPVPEGYDEEHFRLTGETKPLEVIN